MSLRRRTPARPAPSSPTPGVTLAGLGLVAALVGCTVEYSATPPEEPTTGGAATEAATDVATDTATEGPLECDAGDLLCDDECVDPEFDSLNCGECGLACLLDTSCVLGECVRPCGPECNDALHVCDGDVCRCRPELLNCAGVCVDAENDPDHCGDCLAECGPTEPLCGGGECVPDCDDWPDGCEGSCTDLNLDPFNCGACGRVCLSHELCVERECIPYESLDPVQCDVCPCPELCDQSCCFSDWLDANVCVEGPDCP